MEEGDHQVKIEVLVPDKGMGGGGEDVSLLWLKGGPEKVPHHYHNKALGFYGKVMST